MLPNRLTHKFKKSNGKVYWSTATIKGADYDTFEPLNLIWAKDKHRVYCYDSPLRGADRDSFTVLNALFARDKNKAYYLSGFIKEANPATFRALDAGWFESEWPGIECIQGYAADDSHVFHHILTIGKPRLIQGADVATFRVRQHGFAMDKAKVYSEGWPLPKAIPGTFRLLGHHYSTDGTRVYYGNTILPGADAATFQVGPDEFHGFDKNNKYDRHETVA